MKTRQHYLRKSARRSVDVDASVRIVRCHASTDVVIDVRIVECHEITNVVIDVRIVLCHPLLEFFHFSEFLLRAQILILLSCSSNSS